MVLVVEGKHIENREPAVCFPDADAANGVDASDAMDDEASEAPSTTAAMSNCVLIRTSSSDALMILCFWFP